MPFPIEPSASRPVDAAGRFRIDDPWGLRKAVLPLFSYDRESERLRGWGTGFRIDPFGNVATAYHVVEDFFEADPSGPAVRFRSDRGLFGVDGMGLVYGAPRMDPKFWCPVKGAASQVALPNDPFVEAGVRNLIEAALLEMPSQNAKPNHALPVHILARPKVGERVLALGFADLDVRYAIDPNAAAVISEQLYGSIGVITEVRHADLNSSRPWPTLVVDADWAAGMSGGPVFNEAGHVVGLVSTGMSGAYSTAVWFGGWNLHENLFHQLDPLNPDMLQGWGIIGSDSKLKVFHTGDNRVVIARARELGLTKISKVSWEWKRDGLMWSDIPIASG